METRTAQRIGEATIAEQRKNEFAIYDIGEHEGAPYIVSELLEGETLRAAINRGALSPRRAIEYATQIASGLADPHDKGLVHRDLKPEIIFPGWDRIGRLVTPAFYSYPSLWRLRPVKR